MFTVILVIKNCLQLNVATCVMAQNMSSFNSYFYFIPQSFNALNQLHIHNKHGSDTQYSVFVDVCPG